LTEIERVGAGRYRTTHPRNALIRKGLAIALGSDLAPGMRTP